MHHRIPPTALLVALAWLGASGPVRALDVRGFGVFKTQDFLQTGTNAPVLQTDFPAYSFSAVVQPYGLFDNQVVSASVESPPFAFVDQLLAPPTGTDQPLAYYFSAASQAAVDACYPTGAYTLRLNTAHDGGNKTLRLNLSTNRFPDHAPRVANFRQAQSIDPTRDFTLLWDAFSGGTTNDFISVSLANSSGEVIFRSAAFGLEAGLALLNGTNTSLRIPAHQLQAGQTYYGYLFFEKDVAVNTNYPGAIGVAGFSKATSFTLATTGPAWLETLGVMNDRLILCLHGNAATTYVIQAATNLSGANWTSVHTNTGTFNFTDPAGVGAGRRFYRAFQ
jgi:hypothetical protein